jgi:hypothetical protein
MTTRPVALLTSLTVLAGSITGCAAIVQGPREDVKVRSIPPGVVARAGPDRQVITPGEISGLKRNQDHKIVFEKEGLTTREVTLESTPSWWLLGNLVFGGIIGLIVDFATGAGYRLKPGNVEVDMMTGDVKEFDD